MIIQPAAFLKLSAQLCRLGFRRLESVFHCLQQGGDYRWISKREQAFVSAWGGLKGPSYIPALNGGVLRRTR
jgi:hypothetical protein